MDRKEVIALLSKPLSEIIQIADQIRAKETGGSFDVCTILNAKSGLCSEDCKFCAQSSHHSSDIEVYPLKTKNEMVEAAKKAKENGAKRFGIVTSGNTLPDEEINLVADAVKEIVKDVDITSCASLGTLNEKQLVGLKSAGLSRYHHNIETSSAYYPKIVSTHSFEERVETIKTAKKIGLEVCSGGIIGLGESWDDRIDMALLLKELDVDSVPINVLIPIKGTALQDMDCITPLEAIKTIAIFRIILKNKTIKVAAGRETILKDYQALAFMSGANGMLIGGYLTIRGRGLEEDQRLIKEIEKEWTR